MEPLPGCSINELRTSSHSVLSGRVGTPGSSCLWLQLAIIEARNISTNKMHPVDVDDGGGVSMHASILNISL